MFILTEDNRFVCDHGGHLTVRATRHFVTIAGRAVLVDDDPENQTIFLCPNWELPMKPCGKTLKVDRGYSAFIRVDGRAVCLDILTGLTNGTLPETVHYHVADHGQQFVEALTP
jgi:hypothetical protein